MLVSKPGQMQDHARKVKTRKNETNTIAAALRTTPSIFKHVVYWLNLFFGGLTTAKMTEFAPPPAETTAEHPMWAAAKLYLSQWKDERFNTLRPLGEFFDRGNLSMPPVCFPSKLYSQIRSPLFYPA